MSDDDPKPDETAPEAKPEAPKKEKAKPAWKPPPPERLEGAIEAVLLVAGDVVRVERLRDLLGLQSVVPLREAIERIQTRWAESGPSTCVRSRPLPSSWPSVEKIPALPKRGWTS